MELAKTMSRKEITDKFNVPGPTIRLSFSPSIRSFGLHIHISISRMWVLQSQGQDCRKKSSTPKTRVQSSLEDFLSEKKVELESKEKEEDKSLGPQHAELLVRLFKLCTEEATSAMILRLWPNGCWRAWNRRRHDLPVC